MGSRTQKIGWTVACAGLAAASAWVWHPRPAGPATAEVAAGPLEVWTSLDGTIESRRVHQVMSRLAGPAVVTELAPDGAPVKEGDLLARFDAAQWEREALRLDRDFTLAREDLSSLANAKLPLELSELEGRLDAAKRRLVEENDALADTRELAAEALVSPVEARQQEIKVAAASGEVAAAGRQLDLTRRYLQPAALARARATLDAVSQELATARAQISNCVLRATCDGCVVYRLLPMGSEIRTVRVGDALFQNQPFMTLPDMSNLVMRCDVPEADVTRTQPGAVAVVTPLSSPGLDLKGRVEAVSGTAQAVAGRSPNQRYFTVVIGVEGAGDRLRPGMTTRARVLSASVSRAVLIPRLAVIWEGSAAFCEVWAAGRRERRPLRLGMADATRVEVLDGVQVGERVVVE